MQNFSSGFSKEKKLSPLASGYWENRPSDCHAAEKIRLSTLPLSSEKGIHQHGTLYE